MKATGGKRMGTPRFCVITAFSPAVFWIFRDPAASWHPSSGFGDRLHSRMVQPRLAGRQAVAGFPQGIFSGNLCIQADGEQSPGVEMLDLAIRTAILNGFFKRCQGMRWKS